MLYELATTSQVKQSSPAQRPLPPLPHPTTAIVPTHTHIYVYIFIYLYTQTYFCGSERLMPLAWPCWCRRLWLQEVRFLCCRSLRSSPGTLYCTREKKRAKKKKKTLDPSVIKTRNAGVFVLRGCSATLWRHEVQWS